MLDSVSNLSLPFVVGSSLHDESGRNQASNKNSLPVFLTLNDDDSNTVNRWHGRCPGDPHRVFSKNNPLIGFSQKGITGEQGPDLKIDLTNPSTIKEEEFRMKYAERYRRRLQVDPMNTSLSALFQPGELRNSRLRLVHPNNESDDADSISVTHRSSPVPLPKSFSFSVKRTSSIDIRNRNRSDRSDSEESFQDIPLGQKQELKSSNKTLSEFEGPARRSIESRLSKTYFPSIGSTPRDMRPTRIPSIPSFKSVMAPSFLLMEVNQLNNGLLSNEPGFVSPYDFGYSKNPPKVPRKVYELPLPSIRTSEKRSTSPRLNDSLKISSQKLTVDRNTTEKQETSSVLSSSSSTNSNTSINHRSKQELSTSKIKFTKRTMFKHVAYLSGKRWDEPYVGARADPGTPPCSPNTIAEPHDSFFLSQQMGGSW